MMKKRLFKIKFNEIDCGWININIIHKNNIILNINASYVYNPFKNYVDLLYNLNNKKIKKHSFIIDEEDVYSTFEIINYGKTLKITTIKNCNKNNKKWMPSYTFFIEKKEFIKEMKNQLLHFYKKNYQEINHPIFSFYIDRSKLKLI